MRSRDDRKLFVALVLQLLQALPKTQHNLGNSTDFTDEWPIRVDATRRLACRLPGLLMWAVVRQRMFESAFAFSVLFWFWKDRL
jgi:hypothetical protein